MKDLDVARSFKSALMTFAVFVIGCTISGCAIEDDNATAIYGKTGLPVNCRAYVQAVIDGYRSKAYSADDSMIGLERNCGANGQAWKNLRD